MRIPTWIYLLICIGLLIGNVKVYQAIFAPQVLTVTVLQVGPVAKPSNAILVRSPNGKTILIDTGPDASILRALGSSLPMWQRHIDTVILTSTKKAFVGGLPDVQSRYRVSRVIRVGDDISYDTPLLFENFRAIVTSPGIFSLSYGVSVFKISSSTPSGTYISDGKTITQI